MNYSAYALQLVNDGYAENVELTMMSQTAPNFNFGIVASTEKDLKDVDLSDEFVWMVGSPEDLENYRWTFEGAENQEYSYSLKISNICKYAMEGTRVYITLEQSEEGTDIIFRNISANELNITGEELMARFVRGDVSRNTEGSGLGLNIAQSLMNLMSGSLKLDVDGDLFKVTLHFPDRKK